MMSIYLHQFCKERIVVLMSSFLKNMSELIKAIGKICSLGENPKGHLVKKRKKNDERKSKKIKLMKVKAKRWG